MEPQPPTPAENPETVGAGINFSDPHGPLGPYYLQTSQVLLAAILGLVFLLVVSYPLWHTDIWGHMKYGQWMIENGRLPDREPFCDLADQETPHVNFQWLSQLLSYVTFRLGSLLTGGDVLQETAGGVELLRMLLGLLTILRFAFLAAAMRHVSGSGYVACAGVLVSALLANANLLILRPQVLGEAYLAVLLFLVSKPGLPKKSLIAIPLLMVLWANSHGSYPVGLLVLAACLAGVLVAWLRSRRISPWRLLMATLLACAGVAFLNPYGPWLLWHTFALSQHPNIAEMEEWQPITFDSAWGLSYLLSLVLIIVTMVGRFGIGSAMGYPVLSIQYSVPSTQTGAPTTWSPDRLFPLTHWLLLMGFGVQTYLHQRMMLWWVLLVPWILAPHWAVILGRTGFQPADGPSFRKTIIAGLIVWAALMWSPATIWLLNGEPRPLGKVVHSGTPWQLAEELRSPEGKHLPALAEWLKQHYPDGRFTDRIFTTETQGDYLVWALAPAVRLFINTHVHNFPPSIWQECQRVKGGAPDWERILNHRHVKIIVGEAELHPGLREHLLAAKDRWRILLDETGSPDKADRRGRLLIAVRK